jgi:putative redox protein
MADNKKEKIVHIQLTGQNYKTIMTAGRHEITADEPVSVGGQDLGPDPYDLLLMSLGSCSVITMKMYAERKKWDLKDVYIELRHRKEQATGSEKENGAMVDVIEKEMLTEGDLNEEQLEKLLEISKKCPVHRTLMNCVEIKSTIQKK